MKKLLTILALSVCMPAMAEESVAVTEAYALPTAPGQMNGAVFMTITNSGNKGDRLSDVSSEVAEKVEMHTMAMDHDVMKMREVGAYELPSGAKVELTPGGHHIMLINLKQPLVAGGTFPLKLDFDDAEDITVNVIVKDPNAEEAAPDHSHH